MRKRFFNKKNRRHGYFLAVYFSNVSTLRNRRGSSHFYRMIFHSSVIIPPYSRICFRWPPPHSPPRPRRRTQAGLRAQQTLKKVSARVERNLIEKAYKIPGEPAARYEQFVEKKCNSLTCNPRTPAPSPPSPPPSPPSPPVPPPPPLIL